MTMFSICVDVFRMREACLAESFLYSLLSKQLFNDAPVIAKLSTDCITSGGGLAEKAVVPKSKSKDANEPLSQGEGVHFIRSMAGRVWQ